MCYIGKFLFFFKSFRNVHIMLLHVLQNLLKLLMLLSLILFAKEQPSYNIMLNQIRTLLISLNTNHNQITNHTIIALIML